MYIIDVDKDKCTGCEECVNVCPSEVFEMQNGKSEPVNVDACVFCKSCEDGCPEGAVTVKEM
jgi:NAD-dependent dihydropyrimidine dehydrogenase PreA subunit